MPVVSLVVFMAWEMLRKMTNLLFLPPHRVGNKCNCSQDYATSAKLSIPVVGREYNAGGFRFPFRFAVSVLWILDAEYNVIKTWFGRTVILSSYKLFYEVQHSRGCFWSACCSTNNPRSQSRLCKPWEHGQRYSLKSRLPWWQQLHLVTH